MNVNMWESPVVQKNIGLLRSLGHSFVEPVFGDLAFFDTMAGKGIYCAAPVYFQTGFNQRAHLMAIERLRR